MKNATKDTMRYILGLDGGNSKTFAVIVDEYGNLVGKGLAACGNYQNRTLGIEGAIKNYKDAIEQALKMANLAYEDLAFAQYGLAGADREKDFRILRPALSTIPVKNWDVVCDTYEGLRTGSAENVGVVLVCGSGTNAAGRNKDGKTVQIGGFGYLFGDTAGGHHLAQEAFRAAARHWEGRGPATTLSRKVPAYYQLADMGEVLEYYYDNDFYHTDLDMCKLLHQAADEGDGVSIQILESVGRELGLTANSVIAHLGGFESVDIPIVLVGSVIQKGRNQYLLDALKNTVSAESPSFHLVIPEMAPVFGAAMIGMDHLGIPSTEAAKKFDSYGGYSE